MGAKGHSRESTTVEPPMLSGSLSGNTSVLVAAVLAALVVVWAATNLVLGGEGFAVLVPDKVVGGEEAASALARLFAALVLGLFLADAVGWRARWVAGGLVVLGLGHFVFGYLEPLIQEDPPELNESLYEAFVTQTLACALFMVGLFPGRPTRLVVWAATAIPVALVAGYVVIFEFLHGEEWMPLLSRVANPERTATLGSPLVWLTLWHWVLLMLPLGLAAAAVVGPSGRPAVGYCVAGCSLRWCSWPGRSCTITCGLRPTGAAFSPPPTPSVWPSRWLSRSAAYPSFGASPRSAQGFWLPSGKERSDSTNCMPSGRTSVRWLPMS